MKRALPRGKRQMQVTTRTTDAGSRKCGREMYYLRNRHQNTTAGVDVLPIQALTEQSYGLEVTQGPLLG